jgi:hypothetical protein
MCFIPKQEVCTICMAVRYFIRHPKRREPAVWIVGSRQRPRTCLRAELMQRGYDDARGFITSHVALDELEPHTSPKPDAVQRLIPGKRDGGDGGDGGAMQ